MSQTIELFCRMPECEVDEQFDSTEEVEQSDWSEVSSLGAGDDEKVRRRAYCPICSLMR